VLLDSSKPSEFVIFLDNCRVHHSKKVDEFLKENKIEVIYNVPYGPEYNSIERVWAQFKAEFKKQKMSLILEGKAPNYEKMIRGIMTNFPKDKISSI
jgi:transposase